VTEKERPQFTAGGRNFSELVLWGQATPKRCLATNQGWKDITRKQGVQRTLTVWRKQPKTLQRREAAGFSVQTLSGIGA